MDLEQALAKIQELEGQVTGLTDEKTRLLTKQSELLGKIVKLKPFEKYQDLDIDALVEFRENSERTVLETKGQFEELYKRDKEAYNKRLKEIEAEREQEKLERLKDRTKAGGISELSKPEYEVFNPNQLYQLVGHQFKYNDADSLVIDFGLQGELNPAEFIKKLKEMPEYQNQFKSSVRGGSGAPPTGGNGNGVGHTNPWAKDTLSLSEQTKIFRQDPAKAKRLAAEAGAALPMDL